MAPLPKRRHSSRRQAKRTRALNVPSVGLVKCSNCGRPNKPHNVCKFCGYYGKRAVIIKKEKKKKKE